jgi:hypothetical protein
VSGGGSYFIEQEKKKKKYNSEKLSKICVSFIICFRWKQKIDSEAKFVSCEPEIGLPKKLIVFLKVRVFSSIYELSNFAFLSFIFDFRGTTSTIRVHVYGAAIYDCQMPSAD